LTLIGEPLYETWLEYPNYAALDEDAEKAKEFAQDSKWQELIMRWIRKEVEANAAQFAKP